MLSRVARRGLATASVQRVGLVGLGAMGAPMCDNLMAAGYAMTVYDVNTSAVDAAVAKGASRAATPAATAEGADAVITMVPNDTVLRDVVCSPDSGLLKTLRPGGVHISCSTVHPDTSRELAGLHEAAGSSYVGAPIFARADGVAQRLASFCVGGEAGAVAAAMPLLEANSNGT
jgi:3-hydroxyisobutyrate dehydrogenase-like beta-hydroxyacid dehydrogenase